MTALGLIGFEGGLVTRAVHPARTWIDGWNLSPLHQTIRGVADLDGDGRAEAVITSDWGIGVLKHDGTAFRAPFGAPRDSLFGTYTYDATTRTGRDRIVAVDDLTGSGAREILVWNSESMTTLALTATGLVPTRLHNNGTRLGGWVLSTADNRYCGSGRFAGGRKAMVLMSPWGIGLISLDAGTSLFMAPIGTNLGTWSLRADDRVDLIADFDGDGEDELLIRGRVGIGLLKMVDGQLVAIAKHAVGANLGGYVLEGGDTVSVSGRFRSGAVDELLISNLRGFHVLRLNGNRLERRAFVANGTRVDGWIVDWVNNYLLPVGDFTGDGRSDFVVRSPWGLCVMSVGDDNQFRVRGAIAHGSSIGSFPFETSDLVIGAGPFLGSGRNELLLAKPTVGAETAPTFTPREFVNWHGNIRRTLSTVRPTNLAELVSAVRQIQARGEAAGVSGSGWSFTNCVVGTRTQSLIDTSALNATLGGLVPDLIDDRTGDGRRLVHVEAGIKLYDLNCRLDAIGLALSTMGGSRGQSLAGALNTGVHGGDVSLPPIADAVRAIHLVGPGGQQWWIEPAIGSITTRHILEHARARGILDATVRNVYDDDWFNAILVAMGCAGVVYAVVVECRPAFRLRQTTTGEPWSRAQQRIRDLSLRDRRPRFLEINVNPSDSSCRVTVRDETTESDRTPPASSGPSIGAIAAAVGLLGPGALGLFFGAIGDYIARTTAEITALGLVPVAGPVLQAKKTVEALNPVEDAHRLLVELGLAAVDPHNPRRVADVLPTAINLIWAIGAFIVSGRTLVDLLQRELTNQQRPDGTRVAKSFQVMTGQPACTTSGAQNHDETEKLVESYEYAVMTSRCIAFIDRLIGVIAEQRRGPDAIVVNLNLRFTGRTRAMLGMSKFDSTCHVEVYTFRGLRGNDAFKRRLHEVVTEFDAIPHLGQLHLPNEAAAFQEIGALGRWQTAIRAISGGNQMFWSTFAMERGFLP